MRNLRTFTRIVALGFASQGAPAMVASADEPPPPSATATTTIPASDALKSPTVGEMVSNRPEPPAPPRKYLEAGAHLFNAERYDLAATYLRAANLYRDRLTSSERIVLDVYRERLSATRKGSAPLDHAAPEAGAGTGAADAAVHGASTIGTSSIDTVKALTRHPEEFEAEIFKTMGSPDTRESANHEVIHPTIVPAPAMDTNSFETTVRRDTTDDKQKARWLLQLAREQILKRRFDVASQAIDEARALDVKWTVFDETPDRLSEALEKARMKSDSLPVGDPSTPRDKKAAKAWLRAARSAIQSGEFDQAETIVRDVRSWGLGYNIFEDSPDRVATAVQEARRRQAVRDAELMVKTYYSRETPSPGPSPSASDASASRPPR